MKKKIIQLAVGILISVLFLWLAFRKTDLGQIVSILRTARWELLAAAFACSVAGLMIRSYRWKLIGRDYRGVPWRHFFRATSMGLMLNTFLPFRTGDLFQGFFIARRSSLPQSYTLATVVLERLMDVLPPLCIILVGSLFVVLPSVIQIQKLVVLLAFVAVCGMLFLRFRHKLMELAGKSLKGSHSEKIHRFVENIAQALRFAGDRQVVAGALPITFFNWLVIANTSTFFVLRSLGIPLTFFQVFLVQAITAISAAIPASPGFVGTWEFFCLVALSLFNVGKERALSYAVLSHFMAFLPVLVFGLYFLARETFSGKHNLPGAAKSLKE